MEKSVKIMSEWNNSEDDKARAIITNVTLALVVLITVAFLYFQLLERAFNLPPLIDKIIGGAVITISWYYFKRPALVEQRRYRGESNRLLLLLVEDEDANVDMLRWGFDKRNCEYSLQVEKSGEDALKWLKRSMIKPEVYHFGFESWRWNERSRISSHHQI